MSDWWVLPTDLNFQMQIQDCSVTNTIDLECCQLILSSLNSLVFAAGNIGYGKTVSQSGTYRDLSASLALNGRGYDGTGADGLDQCAHPHAGELSPPQTVAYWTVDLGKRHQILNVTIYNRQGKFIS